MARAYRAPLRRNVSPLLLVDHWAFGEVMQKERNASPDVGLGTTVLAIMGATALVAVLFLLSPWNVPQIADKSAPRTMYVAAPHR